MLTLLLFLLAGAAAAALMLLFRVVRGRNKRMLLAQAQGVAGDMPGGAGISVLCSGVRDPEQVENLLTVEYARYEVVVALDSWRYPEEFRELLSRYRMIRVDHTPSGEFPAEGVRALGRSRKRCYRRLLLLDRREDTPAGDFDAAASVASYDFLLPVRAGCRLLPGAVERLVAEVGEGDECDVVTARIGVRAQLLRRDAAVAAGGFARRPARHIPRRRRKSLWEPLFCARRAPLAVPRGLRIIAALALIAGIAAAVLTGRWPLAATLLTAGIVWCAAGCAMLALDDVAECPDPRGGVRLKPSGKLAVKNFTIS